MIIYGSITEKLNKKETEDISIKQANQILNKNNIIMKLLPGHGNASLRKKEIKPHVKEKPFIKIWMISNKENSACHRYLLLLMLKINDKICSKITFLLKIFSFSLSNT